MRAVCNRESLLSACQIASVALASRDIKPILKNLKAIVEPDKCTLMATDLELGIRLQVADVKVEEPGEAILPASRLISILRESTDAELTVEATNEGSTVRGQFNEFEMPSEDPANFPDIPTFAETQYHEVAAGLLREMVRRTHFAVAVGEARYSATTGLLLELDGPEMRLIATDGRRLALAKAPAQMHGEHSTKDQTTVLPAKAMALLERNLNAPDEMVKLAIRPNEVLMQVGQAMIYSRLVEGRYPPYQQVIPQKNPIKVPLTVGPLLSAVRQAAIMTDDESKRVIFTFAKHKLTLKARGAQSGRSRVEMPISYDGKTLEIGFDPKYIVDMLRVLDPETPLTLELLESNKPAVLRNDASTYIYVMMPLATKEPDA